MSRWELGFAANVGLLGFIGGTVESSEIICNCSLCQLDGPCITCSQGNQSNCSVYCNATDCNSTTVSLTSLSNPAATETTQYSTQPSTNQLAAICASVISSVALVIILVGVGFVLSRYRKQKQTTDPELNETVTRSNHYCPTLDRGNSVSMDDICSLKHGKKTSSPTKPRGVKSVTAPSQSKDHVIMRSVSAKHSRQDRETWIPPFCQGPKTSPKPSGKNDQRGEGDDDYLHPRDLEQDSDAPVYVNSRKKCFSNPESELDYENVDVVAKAVLEKSGGKHGGARNPLAAIKDRGPAQRPAQGPASPSSEGEGDKSDTDSDYIDMTANTKKV